ncbi:unnamed protein product [Linum trigynum]|uniref:ATP-dependent DNA helicase n=1 Tax=Linum trigynum TaxID=586398 RepID=A0AAV2E165_9ROSI
MPNLILSDVDLKDLCLLEIDKLLQQHWKTLADFPGLPIPSGHNASLENRMIAEELDYDIEQCETHFQKLYPKLNHQRKLAFDEILLSVNENQGRSFFVDGFGGTGKTFLWQLLCLKLRSEKKIVLCAASSGIAALLMQGGRTAHSRFHIPIDANSTATCYIQQGTELAELIQQTSLIIWDEATMAHKHSIEALDRSLRDILSIKYPNNDDVPFGGVTVVFGGDFRQTLPIIDKGTRSQIVASSLKYSYLWGTLTVLKLKENMRLARSNCTSEEAQQISQFSKWLLEIGDGLESDIFGESDICIPLELGVPRILDPIEDIVNSTYPNLKASASDNTYLVGRAILAPHHNMVSAINSYVLQMFPGEEVSYYSSDSIEVDPGNEYITESDYSVEFLNTLKIGNFPEHALKLKIGCPVILLRNMDQSTGLCNGTRMIIKKLGTWFIEVEILMGTHVGSTVFLRRVTLTTYYKSLNFTLIRRQYPIALCFAMTINKSQGQTLQHVGLCLQKQVFAHGQLYVALSRVTTKHGVKILSLDDQGEERHTMQNIVYREILD